MKVLCVSHSDREFVGPMTSIGALNYRFDRKKASNQEFSLDFDGIEKSIPFLGGITFWEIDSKERKIDFLFEYRPDYKVQYGFINGEDIVVCGVDRVEILDADLKVRRTITHPYLAGTHTAAIDENGCLWVSSAPANAVLCFDYFTGQLEKTLSMPEEFGAGPDLNSEIDLRKKFVPTSFQPTHVNSVVPLSGGRLLLTLWVQGALYIWDPNEGWNELIIGFNGCHGGRELPEQSGYYFTDSSVGVVYFLDERGRILRRSQCRSRWLHDSLVLGGGSIVSTAGDLNSIIIFDEVSGNVFGTKDCSAYGKSVSLASVSEVNIEWIQRFRNGSNALLPEHHFEEPHHPSILHDLDEFLEPLQNSPFWTVQYELLDTFPFHLRSRSELMYEYLLSSQVITLWSGRYLLSASVEVSEGAVSIGILNSEDDLWLISRPIDVMTGMFELSFEVKDPKKVKVVLSANNVGRRMKVDVLVRWISVKIRG